MINKKELNSLKYYIIYALAVLCFFIYSGMIGWNWFNDTPTENARTHRVRINGHYFYHK